MCTHVIVTIPLKLNTAYHARVQDSFAMDVNALVLWLEAANLNNKLTKSMLQQYVNTKIGKRGNSASGVCPRTESTSLGSR